MQHYTLSSIYHIGKADFLQRVRSYSFLIMLGVCVFMIYSFVPRLDAGYTIVSLGNYRGYYNAAWIGAMVANCGAFFALFGFYFVNNAVQRDVETGVGQIIAATRVKNLAYLLGKFCSNLAVLLLILLIVAVMTVLMFEWRGESNVLEWDKLLLPLCILTVPSMIFLAGLALFFDTISSRLGRGIMNIAFLIIWMVSVVNSEAYPLFDIFNTYTVMNQVTTAISATHPDWNGLSGTGILVSDSLVDFKAFVWEGMQWTTTIIQQRLFLILIALGLVLLSTLGFRRFARSNDKTTKNKKRWWSRKKKVKPSIVKDSKLIPKLNTLQLPPVNFSWSRLLLTEVRLLLKGRGNGWRFITAGLFLTMIFVDFKIGYEMILPLIWFFQVLLLSGLGCAVFVKKCHHYFFAFPDALRRQLPSASFTASLFLMILAAPIVLKALLMGNYYTVFAIFAAALFLPAVATLLGTLTKGSKLFEVLFTTQTYCYLTSVPYTDFLGARAVESTSGTAHYILGLAILAISLAFLIRKRQIETI
ncbi:MAG: hypothetical protein AB8G15_01260 [Saprospiraceae bacterium]